jgi:hypothetical protein
MQEATVTEGDAALASPSVRRRSCGPNLSRTKSTTTQQIPLSEPSEPIDKATETKRRRSCAPSLCRNASVLASAADDVALPKPQACPEYFFSCSHRRSRAKLQHQELRGFWEALEGQLLLAQLHPLVLAVQAVVSALHSGVVHLQL